MNDTANPAHDVGLVLAGGGARAAYQVGVLRAVAEIAPAGVNPFPVITGVSAGSINATFLASHATEFKTGVAQLLYFWQRLHTNDVYATDPATIAMTGLRWIFALTLGGLHRASPKSLLDNSPLRRLLAQRINFDAIQAAIGQGALRALGVSASDYHTATAVTFYQSNSDMEPWRRVRRIGKPSAIRLEHILASAALPAIFPAERINNDYFGDGSLRMTSPLSPAIRLGAERLLIIGMRDEQEQTMSTRPLRYPSLGELGGYLLDILFVDNLNSDCERIQRVNNILAVLNASQTRATGLRPIEVLAIHPSNDILDIARRHHKSMPWTIRALLHGLGDSDSSWRLPSYLMFEPAYCSELIELGYQDAMARKGDLREFLGF